MGISSPIFSMFGRSPIKPLEAHIDKANAAATLLKPFISAVLAQDWDEALKLQADIAKLEREADDMKRDLRLHLPKGLFLPVPRTDILELIQVQDRIANRAKDIAGIIVSRRMQIPAAIADDFTDYLQTCLDACAQARKAINELDELLETGFSGNEVTLVENMITKLDNIENKSDDKQAAIRQKLYAMESELSPVDVIFLYQAIRTIGELADCAQAVGGRLQILLAR